MIEFKRILVPTDFGPSSERALEVAMSLSEKYSASITLFHVQEIPIFGYEGMAGGMMDFLTPMQKAAEKQLDETVARVKKKVPDTQGMLGMGAPWQEIDRAVAETHADMVVMGTHGRRGISHLWLGSVAERTVRIARVPVLTVNAGPAAEPARPATS